VALALLLAAAPPAGAQEAGRVVRRLAFEGNKAITDELMASAISTTNSSWFARTFLFRWLGLGEKRYFDEQEFKRDVVRLEVLYRERLSAGRWTPWSAGPADVYITFHQGRRAFA
jgi:outer membrane protein assembly factor BamA